MSTFGNNLIGVEAGGHLAGTISTMALVPRVVDAVAPTLVLAAGGIADARGLVAALCLGADAVVMGTRFLATPEANAHPTYKDKLVVATEEHTVRTILFGHGWPNAPHRTLRTPFVEQWLGRENETQDSHPDEPLIGHTRIAGQEIPVQRFVTIPPKQNATREIDSMGLLAGQSVGLVAEIKPAGEVVREIIRGAQELISRKLMPLCTDGQPRRGDRSRVEVSQLRAVGPEQNSHERPR